MFLDQRRYAILKAIIESYIRDAVPVGSQRLLQDHDFFVSPATMRNEMAFLEQLGLIESPHTSAGRVPTDQGMRLFVDQLMEEFPVKKMTTLRARRQLENVVGANEEVFVKDAVINLAKVCKAVSFATMPWRGDYACFGLSNLLKQQEFSDNLTTSTIMEQLEDRDGFVKLLDGLNVGADVLVAIGEENAVKAFQSCSLVMTRYELASGHAGILGVLGPKRMNYPHNVAVVDAVRKELMKRN